jgi:murein L,D-transpeptidase YafK
MKIRSFFILAAGCGLVLTALFSFTGSGSQSTVPFKPFKKRVPNLNRVVTQTDNPYTIIIDKSDYELQVFDDSGWLSTYPVVFGSKDLSDKMMEGDKKTPDGEFKVLLKKTNKQWGLELLLDYPNPESRRKFEERKKAGKIPTKARIGNGIAIHGTRPESEWTVDNFVNWTDGCISVKYTEMKELYALIPQGTPVTVRQ